MSKIVSFEWDSITLNNEDIHFKAKNESGAVVLIEARTKDIVSCYLQALLFLDKSDDVPKFHVSQRGAYVHIEANFVDNMSHITLLIAHFLREQNSKGKL